MGAIYTPLRYPGGKAKLGRFLSELFKANRLVDGTYAEAYAGGAGAAMHLLIRGYAQRIALNDINSGVVAFWRAVLNHNERFAKRIEKVRLTVSEWDRQKAIYSAERRGFDLGFAFFYLNRTNRSGIMNAGVIGGREQTGNYLMDARFNRVELAERIRTIGRFRSAISITRGDALDFVDEMTASRVRKLLFYFDPPYFGKGRELYTDFYSSEDHSDISKRVRRLKQPWVMTYDDCPQIRALYRGCRVMESELSYSARDVRRGRELVVVSKGLRVPAMKASRGFEII
jgi:DNA adenine methylase